MPGPPWARPAATGALNYYVYALAVFGSDLYVGGDFSNAAGIAEADAIAKWNGSAWSALGSNTSHDDGAVNGHVSALAVSDSDLYVGGYFTDAAGLPEADFIAKWNGTWSALGSNGSGNGALNNEVDALAVSASGLYVGGDFTDAAGNPKADRIAKWNGGAWSALGSNGANDGALNSSVYALAVSGGDVYVGGRFANAAGIAKADYVARWDGTWSALGSNSSSTDGALNAGVNALAVSGSDLFVGGGFTDAAGIATADRVAKWNGSSWSALGSNGSGDGAINSYVDALAVSGTSLYVGGSFNDAAGIHAADYIAKWGPGSAVVRKPDGRIRLGSSGAFVGDNVYNTTGAGQSVAGSAKKGKTIVYQVSVQNDGSAADRFKLKASGTATSKFTVKYFKGSTDITRKVVAGTYRTSSLGVGAALTITVKVTVKSAAAVGTSVTRLLTITSAGNSASKDAVKLVGTRA